MNWELLLHVHAENAMNDRLKASIRFVSLLLLLFLGAVSTFTCAAEIRGTVVSVDRGEPLARVEVAVLGAQREVVTSAVTRNDGRFAIQGLGPGHYTLRLNAVSYRLITVDFSLTEGEAGKEFDITLVPDNFRRTEKAEVKGDIFQGPDSPAIYELNLTSTEIRETSTVVGDDPFRSIQALPGVSASGGNDFFAQFSVMGASYDNTSIYVDGILVPSPFHGTNIAQGATLSIFTSETLESMKLLPAAYPEKYGDSVGAALDLQTREGSRTPPIFRASFGLADSELLGEGELGSAKKGSWIASVRKSYLGYLLRGPLHDASDDISFYDGDLKLTYDVRPNQTIDFYGIGGNTVYDLSSSTKNLSPDDIYRGNNDFVMGRVGWRWAVNPHFLVDARAAHLRAPYDYVNLNGQTLGGSHDTERVGAGDIVWSWQKDHVLEAGWMTRRISESREYTYYNPDGTLGGSGFQSATGLKNDGYIQEASGFFNDRLHLLGGVRLDTAQQFSIHPVSPQVSASLQVARGTQLQIAAGRYNQFVVPANPPIEYLGCQVSAEVLQTANHYTAGIEQRIGENTRVKFLVFDRQSDTSQDASLFDPIHKACIPQSGFLSIERDYSRGAQIILQSRTANRLSGWIGYTLTYARESSTLLHGLPLPGTYFPTLEDQRHTLNVFGSYRIRPTVHVSGKWLFGSGFPVPSKDNAVKEGDYVRLDVRAEKDWAFSRWKVALYGEMLNLTNHNNRRYFYSVENPDGTLSVATGQGLPITPTAGVAFEF